MKKCIILSLLVISSLATIAQTTTWTSDPAHSRLGFKVKHLTISEIDGRFADFSVTVTTAKADYSDAQIEVTAKVASINTGVEARDNHLRSADFFDAEKYPVLTFKSSKMKKTDEKRGKLYGDLTFHGVTKPVVLDVTYFGTVVNPMNKAETAGFQILGSIKRSDFGLGADFPEFVISDEIKIVANAEFSPKK
ncbi:MAG TPA: polyisoprenoid-binding protein [Porphyromonadaceae bacterium]|jgi:polyisoprenoid-binding protein YceI|nr:polyisoprenoid-binding protein [Porphyromonadaceae bacterium]HBL34865.1 polyisoprenoid-binding protein [Porphyromonadaceae bacterium]HBX20698.1 polyisoprenoid-binding protein [Porphyromonadaceae bacterium]HCM20740.1 polyisoprenoid-binding protein [Porphyromonadaceae bacterium]